MALVVVGLVADGLDALVGALAAGRVEDLLHGVALAVVDRGRADLLGQLQAVGLAVDDEDLVGAARACADIAAIRPTGPAP